MSLSVVITSIIHGWRELFYNFKERRTNKKKKNTWHVLLHDVIVQDAGHDRDGDNSPGALDDLGYLLVLQPDDVLPVNFEQLVFGQESVPGRGGVLHDGDNLPFFELEPDEPVAALVQGHRALERPGKKKK